MSDVVLIFTCEHATNHVPKAYQNYFPQNILESHRGWDPGAYEVAQLFKKHFKTHLISTKVSRLLVEVNRSEDHPKLFSEYVRGLSKNEKEVLLKKYYRPHREKVEKLISSHLSKGKRVIHIGVHSFTPVYKGKTRLAQFGLLHDPSFPWERAICLKWNKKLKQEGHKSRLNYPYWGKTDGFTTYLRKKIRSKKYAGIELEISQANIHALAPKLAGQLIHSLQSTLLDLQ